MRVWQRSVAVVCCEVEAMKCVVVSLCKWQREVCSEKKRRERYAVKEKEWRCVLVYKEKLEKVMCEHVCVSEGVVREKNIM